MKKLIMLICFFMLSVGAAFGEEFVVQMHMTSSSGIGPAIGSITLSSSPYGTMFTPDLSGLEPGLHGFHVHENANCGPKETGGKMVPGLAAGGHYDPASSGKHEGPYGNGHRGDLPALYVDADGKAAHPLLAPRIKILELKGRSLMIHAGGDNYSDVPEKLGGGGARIACGVIE